MAKINKADQAEALAHLRKLLKPGTTVFCVLRKVSKSGMSRRIDFYANRKGDLQFLSGWIANACGYTRPGDDQGLRVEGCGMDMGFHVVYELGRTLYPKGFNCTDAYGNTIVGGSNGVTINGCLINQSGDVITKKGTDLDTHVHSGITKGNDNTGPPV